MYIKGREPRAETLASLDEWLGNRETVECEDDREIDSRGGWGREPLASGVCKAESDGPGESTDAKVAWAASGERVEEEAWGRSNL